MKPTPDNTKPITGLFRTGRYKEWKPFAVGIAIDCPTKEIEKRVKFQIERTYKEVAIELRIRK